MNANVDALEKPIAAIDPTAVSTETLPKWTLDATHSHAGFSVKHLMISNVKGEFRELAGELQFDPLNIEHSSLLATLQVASIETREASRDAHLKSADFFDAATYPELTFRSTNWQHTSGDELIVAGDLTIRGVTRPVKLNVESTQIVKDPWGGSRIGFSGRTKINRKDFGLMWNAALEAGGFVVGDDVTITLEAEFVKA
ncbi:MAG: YceI family protein [Bacteroidota bacterium]|nr:YceI family protein [Bacteroidota bacterium]MDP4233044.1 YceI family protein [Bacteroidota bacterium]MDP4241811.1 YceI family protein [Bacteroidota bacterium]MDP4288768.1 YceI family protein [Bacteroidota bacterium]